MAHYSSWTIGGVGFFSSLDLLICVWMIYDSHKGERSLEMHVCTVFALCVQSCIVTPFGMLGRLFGSLSIGVRWIVDVA